MSGKSSILLPVWSITGVVAVIAALFCGAVAAQDTAPAPEGSMDDGGDSADTALTNQPAVTAPAQAGTTARDPFWPVGFWPGREKSPSSPGTTDVSPTNVVSLVPDAPDWPAAEKALKVTSIVEGQGNKAFAVANGQVVAVGETLSVRQGRFFYVWTVKSISRKDGLQLNRQSARRLQVK